jgi:hypothetical protein
MRRINILVEGQTEETFVKRLLAPNFWNHEVFFSPRMPPTSASGVGGGRSFERWLRVASHWLLRDTTAYLTCMFDVYGLPRDFPGLEASTRISNALDRAEFLENQFRDSMKHRVGEDAVRRFIPYLQLHEFEALVFCGLSELEQLEPTWRGRATACAAEVVGFESPEHINNSRQTAPSKRLARHFCGPAYRKTLHGILALDAIGLDVVRHRCHRLNGWLGRIAGLHNLN